jgi:hypothetical protein
VVIQSDLEEQFESLPILDADDRIYALINPQNDGFLIEFFIKPSSKSHVFACRQRFRNPRFYG